MVVGIIGFGMVGKAVHNALLDNVTSTIVDPQYNTATITDLVQQKARDCVCLCPNAE